MPGLWSISSIASNIEGRYKLRHPKESHFKIYQQKGLLDRLLGTASDYWYIRHKTAQGFPIVGPYGTKDQAQAAVLEIVNYLAKQSN